MNIVERVKNICMAPATEWHVIEPEVTTPKELYLNYIVILAAISPVAHFIGSTLFGFSTPFGTIRTPFLFGVVTLVASYLLSLVGVFVIALVSDFLAPKFGGIKNQMQALKLTAYALTPAMVASILGLIPSALLGLLVFLVALYGLYVFFLGAQVLMKVPSDKAAIYTAAVTAVIIVLGIILGALMAATGVMGGGYPGVGMSQSGVNAGMSDRQLRAEVAAAQIAAATAQIQSAANQAQANIAPQNNSTTTPAAAVDGQAAAATALAALAGTNAGVKVEPVDKEVLKGLLPGSAAGLPQTGVEAAKNGISGLQVSTAEAKYGEPSGQHMELAVTDIGGSGMVAMAAAWSMVEVDRSDNNGYEKSGKVNGRPTHEKFDKNGPSGEYAVLIGDRFLVTADGNVAMSALKDGVASIDSSKLEALRGQSVH